VTADALASLVSETFGDGARIAERRPALYHSSLPVEEITVVTADGEALHLAAKRAPVREIDAYRDTLPGLDLCTPSFVAARGDLLLLEWVEGIPLWQSGDLADWEAAARWLARLHTSNITTPLPAVAFRAPAEVRSHPAAARLAEVPPVPVHGEFYPANVLVAAGRIRPLDFETFGLGPAVLDLAALTAGGWRDDEPARIEAAYRAALPPALQPSPDALEDARVLVSLQCRAAAEAVA
jgi:Phosphotransferase enzyme family